MDSYQKSPGLMEVYERIATTRGGKRAIVGVARRLAGKLRACVQNGVFYEVKLLQKQETDVKQQVTCDPVAVLVDS